MTYRKFKADYLFTGREMAGKETVLITSADGTVQSIMPLADAGEGVEYYHGLLSPGFVNCHCHLELSHMQGVLPELTGLVDFLLSVIRQRNQAPAAAAQSAAPIPSLQERIRSSIEEAEQAMLDNGIVAVGDICNTTDTLPEKTTGRLYYHNFIETMGFIGATAAERFGHSRKIYEAFAGVHPSSEMVRGSVNGSPATPGANSIVPHAPYSVSSDLFRLVAGFPGNHLLTIHNQENEAENAFFISGQGDFLRLYQAMGLDVSFWRGTGKRSLESFLPHFHPGQSLILVHNVATTAADLVNLAQPVNPGIAAVNRHTPNLFFCLCPNANLYIGGQLPDIDLLRQQDRTIVIGTDSLASNHQLSILEEIKTIQRAFPHLPTPTLLEWATSNGARALQQEEALGNFLPGHQPGVLLIDNLDGEKLTIDSGVQRLI
jgi:cytosine/adenosine deaminase-related metal-dependent hydrolase